jgi:hypothetical protein
VRELPPLTLGQERIALPADMTRDEEWFIHAAYYAGATVYEPSHHSTRDGEPAEARVRVTLPTLTAGTAEELYDDVRAALRRHAEKHIGPA